MDLKVSYGSLSMASNDLNSRAIAIQSTLDNMDAEPQQLRSNREDDAQGAYLAAKQQWTEDMTDIRDILAQISTLVESADQSYSSTDSANAARFPWGLDRSTYSIAEPEPRIHYGYGAYQASECLSGFGGFHQFPPPIPGSPFRPCRVAGGCAEGRWNRCLSPVYTWRDDRRKTELVLVQCRSLARRGRSLTSLTPWLSLSQSEQ